MIQLYVKATNSIPDHNFLHHLQYIKSNKHGKFRL